MSLRIVRRSCLSFLLVIMLVAMVAGQVSAQGQSGNHPPHGAGGQGGDGAQGPGGQAGGEDQGGGNSKKDQKKVNKDADKLAEKAEQTAGALGRDVVFCILAAHTTGVGTAQELKDKFGGLADFPFGQFVAAVLMADRIDKPLDDILAKLKDGKSLGQIAKEFNVNMGELRKGFGEFRSELARSMTNPPTKDCFKTTP